MAGKKKNSKSAKKFVKKRESISFETKQAIIKRMESGEKMSKIAEELGKNRSSICSIWKDRERIKQHINSAVPMKSTIICKRRGHVLEETEKLLIEWLQDNQARRPTPPSPRVSTVLK